MRRLSGVLATCCDIAGDVVDATVGIGKGIAGVVDAAGAAEGGRGVDGYRSCGEGAVEEPATGEAATEGAVLGAGMVRGGAGLADSALPSVSRRRLPVVLVELDFSPTVVAFMSI